MAHEFRENHPLPHNPRHAAHQGRPRLTTGVSVGITDDPDARKLRIALADDLLLDLGWTKGLPVEIHLGYGQDASRIILKPGARGYTLFKQGPSSRYMELRCALLDYELGWTGMREVRHLISSIIDPISRLPQLILYLR